jgi:hypothetical protein
MARVPQRPHDRGYAASREEAMAEFQTAPENNIVAQKFGT